MALGGMKHDLANRVSYSSKGEVGSKRDLADNPLLYTTNEYAKTMIAFAQRKVVTLYGQVNTKGRHSFYQVIQERDPHRVENISHLKSIVKTI